MNSTPLLSLILKVIHLTSNFSLGELKVTPPRGVIEGELVLSNFSISGLSQKLLEIAELKAKFLELDIDKVKVTGIDLTVYPGLLKGAIQLFQPQLVSLNLSDMQVKLSQGKIAVKGTYNNFLGFPFNLDLVPKIKDNKIQLVFEGISLFGLNLPTFLIGLLGKLDLKAKTQGLMVLSQDNQLIVNLQALAHFSDFNLSGLEVGEGFLRIYG